MLWDDQAVYVAAELEEPHVWATLTQHDSVIFQDNDFEVFLDPDADGHNYGENDDTTHGRGRLWPIFSAERGMYEIARTGNAGAGTPFLAALKQFSTPEGFLPEQVWNDSVTLPGSWQVTTPSPYVPGTPTKSIAPLNWAMGEYISLIASIHAGRIVDVPVIVCSRTLGVGGSTSQITRWISAYARSRSSRGSNGVVPVSIS